MHGEWVLFVNEQTLSLVSQLPCQESLPWYPVGAYNGSFTRIAQLCIGRLTHHLGTRASSLIAAKKVERHLAAKYFNIL